MPTCPACPGQLMEPVTDPQTGLEIDNCPSCLGLWFDGDELSRFFPSHSLATRVLDDDAIGTPAPAGDGRRQCPRCEGTMAEVGVRSIRLDLCRLCRGIWFDQGELSALVESARDGLHGDPTVVGQVTLGMALEGMATLQASQKEQMRAVWQLLSVL